MIMQKSILFALIFLMFILAPIIGVIYLVFWRFICEMWLLMFLMYARMGEIRDRLPPR